MVNYVSQLVDRFNEFRVQRFEKQYKKYGEKYLRKTNAWFLRKYLHTLKHTKNPQLLDAMWVNKSFFENSLLAYMMFKSLIPRNKYLGEETMKKIIEENEILSVVSLLENDIPAHFVEKIDNTRIHIFCSQTENTAKLEYYSQVKYEEYYTGLLVYRSIMGNSHTNIETLFRVSKDSVEGESRIFGERKEESLALVQQYGFDVLNDDAVRYVSVALVNGLTGEEFVENEYHRLPYDELDLIL